MIGDRKYTSYVISILLTGFNDKYELLHRKIYNFSVIFTCISCMQTRPPVNKNRNSPFDMSMVFRHKSERRFPTSLSLHLNK